MRRCGFTVAAGGPEGTLAYRSHELILIKSPNRTFSAMSGGDDQFSVFLLDDRGRGPFDISTGNGIEHVKADASTKTASACKFMHSKGLKCRYTFRMGTHNSTQRSGPVDYEPIVQFNLRLKSLRMSAKALIVRSI